MSPGPAASLGVPWTAEEAALVIGPRADADLLRGLMELLGIPETAPGKRDAADWLGVHIALRPWLGRRVRSERTPVRTHPGAS